jgi:hypothetical protein
LMTVRECSWSRDESIYTVYATFDEMDSRFQQNLRQWLAQR